MAGDRAPRKVELVFFRNDAATEPVRDWLKEMAEADRRAIGTDLLRAQWRWPVGMPLCRPVGKGLWEVRTALRKPHGTRADLLLSGLSGRAARIIKKTRATPEDDLALARKRQKELER